MTKHKHPHGRAARKAYADQLAQRALSKAERSERKAERVQRIGRARTLEALRLADQLGDWA
jgi:hypothetical protein